MSFQGITQYLVETKNIQTLKYILKNLINISNVSDKNLLKSCKKYCHKIDNKINKNPLKYFENSLCAGYRTEKSFNGFRPDILKSGLQKYIRRGNLEKAMWCANELYLFTYAEGGQRIVTNFIHRLMIIYMEDIGSANLGIWGMLDKNIDFLLKRSDKQNEISSYSTIVELLCKSQHTRTLSHINSVMKSQEAEKYKNLYDKFEFDLDFSERKLPRRKDIEIDEKDYIPYENIINNFLYTLDKKRDESYYWCRRLLNIFYKKKSFKKYFNKSKAVYIIFKLLEPFFASISLRENFTFAIKWYKELENLKESILFIYILIFVIINGVDDSKETEKSLEKFSLFKNILGQVIEFDDYVIDMHTSEGRNMKKDAVDFANEGSYVENEWEKTNKKYKEFYNASKKLA